MKCTIKNLDLVFRTIKEWHQDNQSGADFGQFDDESDLLHAVQSTIEQLEEADNNIDKLVLKAKENPAIVRQARTITEDDQDAIVELALEIGTALDLYDEDWKSDEARDLAYSVVYQLIPEEPEATYMCINCGGGFLKEEMNFGKVDEEDFCTDCKPKEEDN